MRHFVPLGAFGKIIDNLNGVMFFKKKKAMSDNIKENTMNASGNGDNLAQQAEMEENLSGNNEAGEEHNLPAEENEQLIEKLQAEVAEMKDKHIRLIAEFENFKRRTYKEKDELAQNGGKDVIQSVLVVLDDMKRAEKQLETTTDVTAIKQGVSLVFNKMITVMTSKGLKPMDAVNQEFDADLHEAITEIPAPNENMKGKIIDVVEDGYYLNGKLIRFAKVVVGN